MSAGADPGGELSNSGAKPRPPAKRLFGFRRSSKFAAPGSGQCEHRLDPAARLGMSSSSKIGIANRKIRPFLRVTRKKMGRTSRVSASRHFETSGQKRGVAGEHEEPFQEPT